MAHYPIEVFNSQHSVFKIRLVFQEHQTTSLLCQIYAPTKKVSKKLLSDIQVLILRIIQAN